MQRRLYEDFVLGGWDDGHATQPLPSNTLPMLLWHVQVVRKGQIETADVVDRVSPRLQSQLLRPLEETYAGTMGKHMTRLVPGTCCHMRCVSLLVPLLVFPHFHVPSAEAVLNSRPGARLDAAKQHSNKNTTQVSFCANISTLIRVQNHPTQHRHRCLHPGRPM